MMTLTTLKTLLSRPRTTNRNLRRRPSRLRRQQPRIEALDPRVLLSVTAYQDSQGTLFVAGDSADDWSVVEPYSADGEELYIVERRGATPQFFSRPTKIVFNGGAGNDYFENDTDIPADMTGGPGVDTMIGGSAPDVYHACDAYDIYFGRGGQDVVFRNGFHAGAAGEDLTVGLVSDGLSMNELIGHGQLAVSRQGNDITLNGPSGAGFVLHGQWSKLRFNGEDYYYTYSPVSMQTAVGDVPATPGGLFMIATYPSSVPDVGSYAGGSWSAVPLNTASAASPLSTLFQTTGLNLNMNPAGLQIGVALGDHLKGMNIDLPVADTVPYLYFTGSNASAIKLGDWTVAPNQPNVTISGAFDPSDPSLVMRANIGLEGSPVSEFAFGWSTNGRIPFTPKAAPDLYADPIYGNIYTSAHVKLGDYPIDIGGDTVIDLDANNDGRYAGLTASSLEQLVRGQFDLKTLLGSLSDIRLGANGTGTLLLSDALSDQSPVSLNVPVSEGTLELTPQAVAFRVRSVDPFAKTPLAGVISPSSFDIQGGFSPTDHSWFFTAKSTTAQIAGYTFGSASFSASSASSRIDVTAQFAPPMGFGALSLNGWFDFHGNFSLSGTATPINIRIGSATMYATASFTLSNNSGVVQFLASMSAYVYESFEGHTAFGDVWLGSAYGWIGATLSLVASGSGVSIRGTGQMSGGVSLPGNIWVGVSASVAFWDHGLRIGLPGLPDLVVTW